MPPDRSGLTAAPEPERETPAGSSNGNGASGGSHGADGYPAEVHEVEHHPAPPPMVSAPAASSAPATAPRRRPPADERERLTWRERQQSKRLRARKVKRIVRRVDPWSVMKISLIFFACGYVVTMTAGILLWNIADRAGVIENIEGFMLESGFDEFEFLPDQILRGSLLIGAVLVVLLTALTVLTAVLFNLISDLVGGIRFTVIEEDGARPVTVRRGSTRERAVKAPKGVPVRTAPVRTAPARSAPTAAAAAPVAPAAPAVPEPVPAAPRPAAAVAPKPAAASASTKPSAQQSSATPKPSASSKQSTSKQSSSAKPASGARPAKAAAKRSSASTRRPK